MKKQEFDVGQQVEVSLIGMVTEKYLLTDGSVRYTVNSKTVIARGLKEEQLVPLQEQENAN